MYVLPHSPIKSYRPQAVGIILNFAWAAGIGSTPIYTDLLLPPTGPNLLARTRIIRQFLLERGSKSPVVATTAPSTLSEVVAAGEDAIKELAANTDAVLYAGAGLAKGDGDRLVQAGVKIFVGYGMYVYYFLFVIRRY